MRLLLVAAALGLLLAGCSEPAADTTGTSATGPVADATAPVPPTPATNATAAAPFALTITAQGIYPVNPSLAASSDTVPAGAVVTLTFQNRDQSFLFDHNVAIEGVEGAQSEAVGHGADATVTFTAPSEPGKHTFYCTLPGHRDRGMVGEITVA